MTRGASALHVAALVNSLAVAKMLLEKLEAKSDKQIDADETGTPTAVEVKSSPALKKVSETSNLLL